MNDIIVNPGDRRHQVQIQQQSAMQDGYGGEVTTWNTIRTTWASIVTAGSKQPTEQFQQGQFSAQVTHIINIRWTASPVIQGGMRVVFASHTYLIQTVDNVNVSGVSVNLMCLEINGSQQ